MSVRRQPIGRSRELSKAFERIFPRRLPTLGRAIALVALHFLIATPPLAAEEKARVHTTRGELERRAGDQWDAAHDAKRPTRPPKQASIVRGLFDKIDALTKIKSFDPKGVAEVLGLRLKYEKKDSNEYFSTYEARIPAGAIRRVEVRVGSDATRGLSIIEIDRDLGITPGEIIDRFGHAGIRGPSIHGPPDAPYYYLYSRPGGELRLGFKPGAVHVLVSVVWDAVESR